MLAKGGIVTDFGGTGAAARGRMLGTTKGDELPEPLGELKYQPRTLIPCPGCGRSVSRTAVACPGCDRTIAAREASPLAVVWRYLVALFRRIG